MDINIVKLKKYASHCSVLYVEDDELIRNQTANFLGRFFPDIVLAEDGAIGLSKYKERSFDVVITDINMPNMNGIEMIEAIKEMNYEQPVLVTSAYNDSEFLMKFINIDVNRFVLKPFNNKHFLYVLYRIAEELSFDREKQKLQNEITELSKRAQSIVEQVHVGIVVIKDNKVVMANKAFLEIGGFDSFDTLKLEMPEIGVLFEEVSNCINASTNRELIEELKIVKEENSKVRINQDSKIIEYHVTLSEIEDENSCILSFSDITAIHDSLYKDVHTKLPIKKFIMEEIDILKQKTSKLNIVLMSMIHFESVEKWYGKSAQLELEARFAEDIKAIINSYMPDAFVGHFEKNQFVIILTSDDYENIYNKFKNINISSSDIIQKRRSTDKDIELSTNIKIEHIDTNKKLHDIEVDLINLFDMM